MLDDFANFFTRLIGPVFVGGGTALISVIVYCYFAVILPTVSDLRGGYLLYYHIDLILDISLSLFIVFNIYFNYFKCISTDPGSPSFPSISAAEEITSCESSSLNQKWTFCKKCEKPKPPRTHHCKVCDKCVLKFDHHCPWMANCIGFNNYRYFILFLTYLWLGCVYLLLHILVLIKDHDLFGKEFNNFNRYLVLVSSVFTALFVFVVGFFIALHYYFIATNQTTVENISRDPKKIIYNLGSISKNINSVFGKGDYWFSFLLPWYSKKPIGNGCHFKINPNLQHNVKFQQMEQV